MMLFTKQTDSHLEVNLSSLTLVIARIFYQIGRRVRRDAKLEKQEVLTEGFAEQYLRWIFKRDIQAITPKTFRVAGLFYYFCARKPY
jgi:hypothetical protein